MNTETLRWYLYQLGMPTDKLATLLGLHHDTIRHWVEGDRQPPKWIAYPLIMELWYDQYSRGEGDERRYDANSPNSYRAGFEHGVDDTMNRLRQHLDVAKRSVQEKY